MRAVEIPLSSTADAMLADLARATHSEAIASIDGQTLLGERAMLAHSTIPDRTSAGGGCRLFDARDAAVALNLSRSDDRELLPALFASDSLDPSDNRSIAEYIAASDAASLVARGRSMGLAIASDGEAPASITPCVRLIGGTESRTETRSVPRVIDLSALWAGPLASHLLALAGAEVIKVESASRPDAMRDVGEFFALINQGKASVVLDFKSERDLQALKRMLAAADIVIEAARPRALEQVGIDATTIVGSTPGLVWITITAHGTQGDAANWVGFGDDCGVAGGLSNALRAACGQTGFVGDAIADPLTGIFAAATAWNAWTAQSGGRFGIAMSHVVAQCIHRAQRDRETFERSLRAWRAANGQPFPEVQRRTIGTVASLGEHTQRYRA